MSNGFLIQDDGERIQMVEVTPPIGDVEYFKQIGLEGIPAIVNLSLYRLLNGDIQRLTYKNPTLGNGADVKFYFKAKSDKDIRFEAITVYSRGDIEYFEYVKPYSMITIDPSALGTDLKPKTKNANEYYYTTKPTTVDEIRLNPTFNPALSTDELWSLIFPGTGTGVVSYPFITGTRETIVKAGSERVFVFKNISGLSTRFSIDFFFSEIATGGMAG